MRESRASIRFLTPILVLVLLLSGAGCRHPKPSIDLTCDVLVADSASRLWDVRPRQGTTTDSALYALGHGRLVIRGFARGDSTPIAETLTIGLLAGPNPNATFHEGVHGAATIDTPAGFYVGATRCLKCPRTTWPHTVVAGRVDTVDLYLGQMRPRCDAAIP